MHYMARRSYRMQKHKFGKMCSGVLFMETAPSPPEHEKLYVDVSCLGRSGMHNMTHISHQIQKHKFCVTCSDTFFVESVPVQPKHEK
jgi:hypothetical protein